MTDKELLQRKLRLYSELLGYPFADKKQIMLEMQRLAFQLRSLE